MKSSVVSVALALCLPLGGCEDDPPKQEKKPNAASAFDPSKRLENAEGLTDAEKKTLKEANQALSGG